MEYHRQKFYGFAKAKLCQYQSAQNKTSRTKTCFRFVITHHKKVPLSKTGVLFFYPQTPEGQLSRTVHIHIIQFQLKDKKVLSSCRKQNILSTTLSNAFSFSALV
jgi:hypothetical protein